MKKRIISIILSIVMLVGLLSTTALAADSHTDHCACGAEHKSIGDHTTETIKTFEVWDNTTSLPSSGNYYLNKDVALTATANITGELNLCLNGKSITSSLSSTIQVNSGATLNICDCSTGETAGKIANACASSNGRGIYNLGTVTVYGGTIEATGDSGRGIYNGTVNIYGGTIQATGTGIYLNNGTGTVSGGTVRATGTGIYLNSGCSVTVSGGTIEATGNNGRGIDNSSGANATVTGGNVTATGSESYGVYNGYAGSFELSGDPTITGTAADVYIGGNGAKIITITGALNYAEGNAISIEMSTPGTFTSGWTEKMSDAAENYGSYFTSADGSYTVQPDGSGELKLAAPTTYTVTYDASGATSGTVPTDGNSYTSGSTVTVLGNTGALAKTGHAFVGWNTWSNGYGTDYAPGATFNINSNTTLYAQWEEYEITSQPVENDPSVGTNADSDIASYQWYKGTMSDVTDATEGVSAYTEDELTSSYSGGWWTYHGTGETTPGYFTIALNAGDSILAQTSATISEGQLGIWAAYEKQDWDWTTPDDHFLVTAPADGNYDLHVSDVTSGGGTQPTVKAQVFHIGSTPADGATGKALVAAEDGWYACKITYKDGTVLYSGPVEYEAPASATYTVTFNANGHGTAPAAISNITSGSTITAPTDPTATGYTFGGWYKEQACTTAWDFATDTVSANTTLYAKWTANTYAVTLNAGVATINNNDVTSYTYGVGATLPADGDMTKASHRFDGWYESADFSGSPVTAISTTATGDKTYYAKWTEVHTITGVVKDSDDAGIDGVTVKLMQGNDQFGTNQTTSNGGHFSFTSVPLGNYNVVAVQDQKTKTELVIIEHTDETLTIDMPSQNVSSTLNVSGSSTPDIVVGGLDDEAVENAADGNTHVSIGMRIESKEDVTSGGSGSSEEVTQQTAIKQAASAQQLDKVEFLSITVTKTVTTNGTPDNGTELEQTQTVLELIIPYSLAGKYNIGIYRHHDGWAEAFAAFGSQPDEQAKRDKTFWIDTGKELIHIYTNRFSNYAIAYSDAPVVTPTPDPAPSGGDYTPTYAITVEKAENGEVKANRSYAASGSTVTITVDPEAGYVLNKLTVTDERGNIIDVTDKGDGTFTFKMPGRKVTVEASFAAVGSYSTCPGDHTCPIWPYTDAETTAWYHDGVHYCIENGLMAGYGDGIFKPNADTTRAMITVMLWRLNGSPAVNDLLDFEDVEEGQWYTEAIRWAKSEGIATGYGNGYFGTNDAVTREQMVTILWRYAQHKGYDVSVGENTNILSYNDAFDVAEYAIPAMQWACGSGMVKGMNDPDGEGMILAPESKGTRAQIATMMMRFCTEIVQK